MDSQPEFTKAIWDYLDILVNDNRLAKGREILAKYKPQFDAVEKAYGVDRYIDRVDLGHRIELLDADGRSQRAAIPPRRSPASAAARPISGMSSSLRWKSSTAAIFGPSKCAAPGPARSARRNSCRPRSSATPSTATATAAATSSTIRHDLIASTANNLKKDGWQTGQTWGYEVVLPQGFNFMLADRAKAMTIAQWEQLGLKRADGKPFPNPTEKAYLLAPAGAEGPGFLMLQNFRVIMKYNPAEAYALAIGHFADRLRGGPPFVQPWPRQERVLSRAERLELQQLLAQRGFYRGTPDGQFGGQTREALRGFQASIGAPADGFASSDVLERLAGAEAPVPDAET